MIEFHYDKTTVNTQSGLQVSVADMRDLIQAFGIPDKAQRLQELQVVLEAVERKNRLPPGSLWVE